METNARDIGLKELWFILFKKKLLIFLLVLLSAITATVFSFFSDPEYRASTTIQIDRSSTKMLKFDTLSQDAPILDREFYNTQYELLKSVTLVRRVIKEENLEYFFVKHNLWSPSSKRKIESVFLNGLKIEPVNQSRLVNLHFHASDPELATNIVNSIADNFIQLNLEKRSETANYAIDFLNKRIKEAKGKLEASEAHLNDYARKNGIVEIEDSQTTHILSLININNELSDAEQERISAEANYREMNTSTSGQVTSVIDNLVIKELKNLKAQLEVEYEKNAKIYEPNFYLMEQLAQQIETIQNNIEREKNNIRLALEADYRSAAAKEQQLKKQADQLKAETIDIQGRSITLNILKREVDANKYLYDALLHSLKEVGIASVISNHNIHIIDKAYVPLNKYKPNLKKNVMIGIAVGLFLGVGLVFLLEIINDSVKSSYELEKITDLPILARIPVLPHRTAVQLSMSTFVEQESILSEAFHSLRTSLLFTVPPQNRSSILITSPSPNEGKTTIAINLAISYAMSGKRVLLIDADLRRPSIHHYMKEYIFTGHHRGLIDYLAGSSKPEKITRSTVIDNLFVITSGGTTTDSVRLLSDNRMKILLKLASSRFFDHIIIDSPPVMEIADTLILANLVDSTLLAIKLDKTQRSELKSALVRLNQAKTHFAGTIIINSRSRRELKKEYEYKAV